MAVERSLYDGWNRVAAPDGSNSIQQKFTWGLGLAGSLTAADGVGALLWIEDPALGAFHFACSDGNGNVASLINGATKNVTASYEYGPFGESIRRSGSFADKNPYRFSTKIEDSLTGLIYYGNRYLKPSWSMWLSKDPIEETGGVNLYAFVANDPVNKWDYLGLSSRKDIDSGSLIYSTKAGWIDWGHANPSGARQLWADVQFENGTDWDPQRRGEKFYLVGYRQQMGKFGITAGTGRTFAVKRGLSDSAKKGVTLGIFKHISNNFEGMQASFPYRFVTNSGNSEEDRPSDLISLYRAIYGYSKEDVEKFVDVRSKTESKCLWDSIGGLRSSNSWQATDYNGVLSRIIGKDLPSLSWPSQFSTIEEISPSGEGVLRMAY